MTTMSRHDAYEKALLAEEPIVELRSLAARQLERGVPRDALLQDFESLRSELQASHREDDEDVVLDVMDDIVGFTSPHSRL